MIPYVEILKWNNDNSLLKSYAVVEPSECWFELSYYETGQFEVYAPATANNLQMQKGQFVKIPNKPYLWYITSVQYEFNSSGARMIDVKGFEAKWIVSKRIIRDPLELPSNLQTAMELLFDSNLGSEAIQQRQIAGLVYDFSACSGKTTDAQATRGNLYDFTLNLLKLHKVGLYSVLENGKVKVIALNGTSKNILFAQSMDNLISATYYTSDEKKKTNCQIVSTFSETTGSGTARTTINKEFVAYYPDETAGATGIDRDEMTLSPNLSTKVKQPDGTEIEIDPESEQFQTMQQAEGKLALAERISIVDFNAEIDLSHSQYVFAEDYFIGDLVSVRDEYFGYEASVRIHKFTFKQDSVGYSEEADYGSE